MQFGQHKTLLLILEPEAAKDSLLIWKKIRELDRKLHHGGVKETGLIT
jgi:hypothetical protein